MGKNEELDLVRDRTDIVELVREYVPGLKRVGKSYKARCPFHNEKTPSFHVDGQKGFFYCFGCQEGGDAFDFLMKIENLSFTESVQKLASKAGIYWKPKNISSSEDKLRIEMKKALLFARNYYHKILFASDDAVKAREYLKSRNIGKTTAEKFGLGFSPEKFDDFYKQAVKTGFLENTLIKAGLVSKKDQKVFDYFKGRLMFPITNTAAEVVGFGGRILSQGEPKYLNSPETSLFHKGRVLFGLDISASEIRKRNHALLLEGYTDVITCHKFGIETAVAPLGTAVGFEHARLLKRYADEVTIVFDGDDAGINAAIKAAQVLTSGGLYVKLAQIPEKLDPDDYLHKYGKTKMLDIINSAKDLADYHLDILTKDKNMPISARDKSIIAGKLAQSVSVQTDEIIKKEWIKQISQKLQVDYVAFENRAKKIKNPPDEVNFDTETEKDEYIPSREVILIGAVCKFPKYIGLCLDLTREDFISETASDIWQTVCDLIKKGLNTKEIFCKLMAKYPQKKNLITKISIEQVPENFDPRADISQLVRLVKKAGIEKKIKDLRTKQEKLKNEGADTTALKKEEIYLTMLLKSSKGIE